MLYKGKHVHHSGGAGGGQDFFGYGDAIREALERRLPRQPARALDVGTGFGRNAVFLAQHLPPGSHVWSVDPSEDSLKRGEGAIREAGLTSHVSLALGAAESLPFGDGAFDLTTALMIFHHLVEALPALREMARVTRLGGKLLLVDWEPAAHILPFAVEHRQEDFFTWQAVGEMLREAGLRPAVERHPMWYVIEAVKE